MILEFITRNLMLVQVYAQEMDSYEDVPEIVDAVRRGFNILIGISGAVFIAFIIMGAYKFLTSQGDPKGIAGAKQSITYAFIGFSIILGVFAINAIVAGILGVPTSFTGGGIFNMLQQGLQSLVDWSDTPAVQ